MRGHHRQLVFLMRLAVGLVPALSACRAPVPPAYDPAWRNPPRVQGSLYGTSIDYGGSEVKRGSQALTGYLSIGDGRFELLEFALGRTHVDYRVGDDVDQTDLTAAYTNTSDWLREVELRFGLHLIESNDPVTDDGFTLFGKVLAYETMRWNSGMELAYTRFHSLVASLDLLQASPRLGLYLWRSGDAGTLYTETWLLAITKDDSVAWRRDGFYSIEQSLAYVFGALDLGISGWVGERLFAVEDDGFIVNNTTDLHHGGIRIEAGYTFEDVGRLALRYRRDEIEHGGFGDKATQSTIMASFSLSF